MKPLTYRRIDLSHKAIYGVLTRARLKHRIFLALLALVLLTVPLSGNLQAQFSLGADVVSRYIWRGTDFGNSASIQPYFSYGIRNLEIGAWSSWAITSPQANENDLYLTYALGSAGITLTDYYFPVAAGQSDFFNYDSDAGNHILEASGTWGIGDLSLLAAYNFSGDPDHSAYVEGSYQFYSKDDIEAAVTIGAGDQVYVTDPDGGWNVVNLALNLTKDQYSVSYILNPDADISWMVLGVSF